METTNDAHQRWDLGDITLERVRYFDTPLPAESLGLEGAVGSRPWTHAWAIDGQPGVGQAFWVVTTEGRSIVVDPCGASDDFLRVGPDAVGHQEAAFGAFRSAGLDPDSIEQVVLSHLDGIGMVALADGADAGHETWTPAFPNAVVVVSAAEHAFLADQPDLSSGSRAFGQLDALGVVRTVDPPATILPGVTLEWTGGHGPGHCVVRATGSERSVVLVGHLAVSPLHTELGPPTLHLDPDGAWQSYRPMLEDACDKATLLAGPLWPTPGVAAVERDGDGFALHPVGT